MMKSPTIFSFTPSLMNAADLESIFVQREAIAADLVERIRESVLTSTKHHSLIIGTRGIGKTHLVSLVYHRVQVMADLHDRILIAWLREEEWGITSFLKLLLRILRSIDSSDSAIQQRIEALYELSSAEAEQAAMSLLTEIIGQRTLLLITENLDDLFKGLGDSGQKQLRAFLQNSGCCTILATAPRLFNGVQSRTKPFYGFFRPVRLQELTAAEAVQLLIRIASLREQTELVSFLKTPMGKARVQAVEHLAGGNPRIYVIFAEFLSRESLEELVQPFMALLDALTPYYQSRMQYLSAQQREIVEFLCDRKYPATVKDIAQRCFITSQTTSSQLKELKEKGYVNVESIGRESFYALQEPLMRICLGMKKERESTLKFMVDFLRAWYSKSELDVLHKQISDELTSKYLELALQSNVSKEDPRVAVYWKQVATNYDLGFWADMLPYTLKLTAIRGSAEDWIKQSIALGASGLTDEALISCDNALAIESDNIEAWNIRGIYLTALSRHEESIASFDRAIQINMDDDGTWNNRGNPLAELGRYEEAINSYDRAVELAPNKSHYWKCRSIALEKAARYEDAIYSYEQAIRLEPNEPDSLFHPGISLFNLGRYEEAIASFDRAIKSAPDESESWSYRGMSLSCLGRYEEALTSFDRAIQLEPDRPEALYGRGILLFNLDRYEESISSYKKVIELKPDIGKSWYRLGLSLSCLDRDLETVDSCNKAIEFEPEEAEYWNLRGVSLFNLGRHKESIINFEKAIEIDPGNLQFLANRSEFLLATSRWNEGSLATKDLLNRFKQSNESYPGNIEPVLNGLLTQDSSQWQSRIPDLISWFEPFPTAVTNGLVSACKKLISPLISNTTATLWHDTWHELTHHLPEYQLPLHLLTTALHYKQKPDDPRVWMKLSIEERKILQQTLGIDSIELCN